jgi:aminocarboxymuconate-semialdehyde decarboxylase
VQPRRYAHRSETGEFKAKVDRPVVSNANFVAQVGAAAFLPGSDYCFEVGHDIPVQFVEQPRLTPEERRMILHGTAAKLLKI